MPLFCPIIPLKFPSLLGIERVKALACAAALLADRVVSVKEVVVAAPLFHAGGDGFASHAVLCSNRCCTGYVQGMIQKRGQLGSIAATLPIP
jgi:hypothetical protein